MTHKDFFFTRVRPKGQITLPAEVRQILKVRDGDNLIFRSDESGRVVVERGLTIPADQAWFWSERWQELEHAAQADIQDGRLHHYKNVDQALTALEHLEDARD